MDTGDAVVGVGKQAEIKTAAYAEALAYMGYDAVAMGETEARYVAECGNKQLYGKNVPLLAVNAFDAGSNKPLADKAYIVKKTQEGLKVGITAVIGDNLIFRALPGNEKLKITDALEAVRKQVDELRKKVDLVVLLSHTGYDLAKRIATEIPGIDVILVGHQTASSPAAPVENIGSTVLMQAKSTGTHIGKLVLDINQEKKIANAAGEYVPLTSDLADDPRMVKVIEEHDRQWEAYIASLRAQYSSPASASTGEVGHSQPRPFVGALKCRECHRSEYDSWLKTAHAKAFQSLRKNNRTTDPECVSCHTTGYKSKGGFTSEYATPQLQGVQCEACHGAGVIHTRRPAKGFGAVLQSSCTQCHDAKNSPNFNFKAYREKILHKADAAAQ